MYFNILVKHSLGHPVTYLNRIYTLQHPRTAILNLYYTEHTHFKGHNSSNCVHHYHRVSTFVNQYVHNFNLSKITHLNTTFCDWFQPTRMGQRGWWVGFPHSSATMQISLSSVKARLLSETDSFHALWNDKLLKSFNIFYVSKGVLFIKKNKFSCFTAFWGYLIFHSWYFVYSCKNRRFTLKMDSSVHYWSIGPN
jgi:hypothetical protein